MNYIILACAVCYILSGGVVTNAATNNVPSTSRVPFLPSARRAKKAYLNHLQNELETAQRQLYVSQNTCNTLRKRCEDQRKESLLSMSTRNKDIEIENQKLEIDELHVQLQRETDKQLQQEERFNLIAAELKELQAEKDSQEQYNENKLLEYEQQIKDSKQQYDDQIDMLKLKLEAAEYVAKQQKETVDGVESSTRNERAQLLRSELEGIRAKYSAMFIKSLEVGDIMDHNQMVEELDTSIQSVVESALDTIDKDWSARYKALEEHITSLEKEKGASVVQADHEEIASTQLREELTTELTETLTNQSTEKMEKKYKKKIRQLRKELKEANASDSSNIDVNKMKEQLKVEYEAKLQELQQKNEEQETFHKEQMRKLVKAVMEREAKQKEQSAANLKKDTVEEETKPSSKKKKKKSSSGSKENEEESICTSSSRKRSKPSVVPVRRSNR